MDFMEHIAKLGRYIFLKIRLLQTEINVEHIAKNREYYRR